MQTFRQFVEQLNHKNLQDVMDLFVPFVKKELGVNSLPHINMVTGKESQEMKAFGCWDGEKITLNPEGRHPMDVMRTLAHELVHYSHGHTNGEDGSDDENEANAKAGVIMRRFAKAHPDLF
jgi:N-acetylglucosamine-6-phosphate deacetylase